MKLIYLKIFVAIIKSKLLIMKTVTESSTNDPIKSISPVDNWSDDMR